MSAKKKGRQPFPDRGFQAAFQSKGSLKNKLAILSVEVPVWQGAKA